MNNLKLGLIPPETSSRNSRHLLLDREVRQLSPAIEWASVGLFLLKIAHNSAYPNARAAEHGIFGDGRFNMVYKL